MRKYANAVGQVPSPHSANACSRMGTSQVMKYIEGDKDYAAEWGVHLLL